MKGLFRRILALAIATVMLVSMATNAYAATFTLPSDLKTIEAEAFEGDKAIEKVVLPDGVTTIGSRAFADSSLESINLPRSLTSIAADAFEESPNVVANVKSGSYAMTYCEENNIPYVTDPVSMPNKMIPISVSASASTVEMGDTVTLTFTADNDLPAGTECYYSWNEVYLNAAGEVISSTDNYEVGALGAHEMLVQCAGAAKLRISVRDEADTIPGANPTVEIAITGSDSKPYLEYSVAGEAYPGGTLRATVIARNADKLTSDESVTITDEMGSFTQTVTVNAANPKVSIDVTVPRTWSLYDENEEIQEYGVVFKHGNDEYTHYAYGEPLCEPSVGSVVGDIHRLSTRIIPSEMPYTYAIADPSVATIDGNGTITFLSVGTTTATLTTKTGIVFPFTVEAFEESSEGGESAPVNDPVLYVSAPRSVINYGDDICPFYICSDVEDSLPNHVDESIPICLSFYDADNQLIGSTETEQWLEGDVYQPVWADWTWWYDQFGSDYSYIEFAFGDTEYEVIEPSTARVRVRSMEEQGKLGFLENSGASSGRYSVGQTVTVSLTCTTPEMLATYAAQGEVKVTAVVPYHSGEEIIKDVVPAVFDADTLTATLSFTIGEDVLPGCGYDVALYCGTQKIDTLWIRIASGVSRLTYSTAMVTGESRALPIGLPEDVDFSRVYFQVEDPSVVSVNANGVATALAAGETHVYVYCEGTYGSIGHENIRVLVYDAASETLPVLSVKPLADSVAFGQRLPVKVQLSGDTSALADSEVSFVLQMTLLDANKNYLNQFGRWYHYFEEELIDENLVIYADTWVPSSQLSQAVYLLVTLGYTDSENAAFMSDYDYSLISLTDVPEANSTIYSLTIENDNPEDIRQGDWVNFSIKRLPQSIGRDVPMSLCDAEGNEICSETYYDGSYSCGMSMDTCDFEPYQTYTYDLYMDGEPVDGVSVSFYLGEPRLGVYGCPSRMPAGGGDTYVLEYRFTNDAYGCPVTFSSSDESVATIDENNEVHALSKGTVMFTATCEHGQTAALECIVYDPASTYVPEVYIGTDAAGTVDWMDPLQYKIGVSGDLSEIPYEGMEFDAAYQLLDADGNVLYDSAEEGTYAHRYHSLQGNEQYEYWYNDNVWRKAVELDARFIRLVLTTNTQSSYNYTIDESRSSVTFGLEPLETCSYPIVSVSAPEVIFKGESIDVTFTCYNPTSLGSGKTVKLLREWNENDPLAQGLLTQDSPSITLSYTPEEGFSSGEFQYFYPSRYGNNSHYFYVFVFTYNALGYDTKINVGDYSYFYPDFGGGVEVPLTYTSSNEAVATAVDAGNRVRVDAVAPGTTVITGTTSGGESRSFTVTVYDSNNTVAPVLYLDQSQNGATREWENWIHLTLKTDTEPWQFSFVYATARVEYLDADGNVVETGLISNGTDKNFATQTDTLSVMMSLADMANYYERGARSVRFTLLEGSDYTVDSANASVTMNIADPMLSETPIIFCTLPQYTCVGDTFDVTFTCMNPQTLGEGVRCAFQGNGYAEQTEVLLTQDQPSVTGTITPVEEYVYADYYVSYRINLDAANPSSEYRYIPVLNGSIYVAYPVVEIGSTIQAQVNMDTQYDELSVTWESADSSIATVDESGVVTGVSVGVTQILAHYGPLTMSETIRVYDSSNAEIPVIYLGNYKPDEVAGPSYNASLYTGTTTALETLGSGTQVSYAVEAVDAQGEVVESFYTFNRTLYFAGSNEESHDLSFDSYQIVSALHAGATHLRIRLLENEGVYTIDSQRSAALVPISDPSTWNETTFYATASDYIYQGHEATIDVEIVSYESGMEDADFVCTVSVSDYNKGYFLEPTEQIINASNPSVHYAFTVPEDADGTYKTVEIQVRSQDGAQLYGATRYMYCVSLIEIQQDFALEKGATRRANYAGNYVNSVEKSFESSNPEVATVDENGTVTGVSVGVATITAHIGELEPSFAVRVYDAETMTQAKLSLSAPQTLTEWPWTGKGELLLTADQPVDKLGALSTVCIYSHFYDTAGTLVGDQGRYYDAVMIQSNQIAITLENQDIAKMAAAGAVSVTHELMSYNGDGFIIDSSTESACKVTLPMQPLVESSEPLLYSNTSSTGNYVFSNNQYPLDIHAANTSYSSPVTVLAYDNVSGSRVEFDRVTFTPSEGADVELNIAPPAGVSSFVVHAVRVNSDNTETCIGTFDFSVALNPVAVATLAELQSQHPYTNNFNYIWSYTVEGAKSLAVTFSEDTQTESEYCDPLKVGSLAGYESNSMEHTLGGNIGAQTVAVDGDTVIIWLKTDGSVTGQGFTVTQIDATMEDSSVVTITE